MAGIDADKLERSLSAPEVVKGDQGMVKQRSVSETIKADRYLRRNTVSRHTILRNSVVIVSEDHKNASE